MSQGSLPEDAGSLARKVRQLLDERRASLSASDAELLQSVLTFLEDAEHRGYPVSRSDLIAFGGQVVRIVLDVLMGT